MTVVVVGAGSAGLSVSRELRLLGVEHVVFERHRLGHDAELDLGPSRQPVRGARSRGSRAPRRDRVLP
jgi:cation diffusion facilitator CzcD-associated flavoprotein CzcO